MTPLLHRSKTLLVAGALLLLAVSAALLASASLQSAGAATPITPVGRIGGVIHANMVYAHGSELAPKQARRSAAPGGSGLLTYHGGPVMRTNKTYAIYWVPSSYSVSANYQALIDRYFTDVAAVSGSADNVYSVETQYYDQSGGTKNYIAYNSTFGGSVLDTKAFPASGCSITGLSVSLSKCLTDSQIISEINSVISSQGWTKNATTQFFLFTPKSVGSCFSSGARNVSSNPCSFTDFCAYHGYESGLIYANQPYAAIANCYASSSGQGKPNGDDADLTLNVTSHEHREAINDPQLDAWYDAAGWEGSDKCAWDFGTALGGSGTTRYNQVINGNHYSLQQEYSNAGNACLLKYGSGSPPPPPPPPPPPGTAPTIGSFSPSSGLAGTASVVLTGTNYTGVSSVSIGSTAISTYSVDGTNTHITATIPDNALTGTLKVVASGGTVTSSSTFKVLPRLDSFSPVKGPRGSSVTVTGNSFTGTTRVTLNGRSCSFTVLSNTQVKFTVPSFFASSGKIVVTTPGGTATSLTNFVIG